MRIKTISNAGFDDEITVEKIYVGEFGIWCPGAGEWHKVEEGDYNTYCRKHGNTVRGYKLVNDKGEVDVWGEWNFEKVL
jgi:hypothetical protein